MQKSFTFHHDAGHGWLAVPYPALIALGFTSRDFSGYSYHHANVAYLEEDCDAPKFVAAFEKAHGFKPAMPERYDGRNSKIRGYRRNGSGA